MDLTMELISNLNRDIPIITEEEEDAISFIERTYQENCLSQPKKSNDKPFEIQSGSNAGESFYLKELLNSYKDRIASLESELKRKDIIINNLLNLTKNLVDESKKPCVYDIQTPNGCHSTVNNSSELFHESVSHKINISTTEEKHLSVNDQLSEVRKNRHETFLLEKQTADITNTRIHEKKVFVIGDSMLNGIKEKDLETEKTNVKVRYFSGAKVVDIVPKVKELLEENPNAFILHAGTNDAVSKPSNVIIDELLSLKNLIENKLPKCKVYISTLTPRTDDGKASLTINNFNKHLNDLKLNIMDNKNISVRDLGKKGLHLSRYGKKKFTKNISYIINELEN